MVGWGGVWVWGRYPGSTLVSSLSRRPSLTPAFSGIKPEITEIVVGSGARKFDSSIFRFRTRDKRMVVGWGPQLLQGSSVLSVMDARKFDSGVFR